MDETKKELEERGFKRIGEIVHNTDFFILRLPENHLSKEELINLLCNQKDSVIDESELQINDIDDQEDRASLLNWLGEFGKILKGEL